MGLQGAGMHVVEARKTEEIASSLVMSNDAC